MEVLKTGSLVVIAGFCLLVLAQCMSYGVNTNRIEECKQKYGYDGLSISSQTSVLEACRKELFGK